MGQRERVWTCRIEKYFLPLPGKELCDLIAHTMYNVVVLTRQPTVCSHITVRNATRIRLNYADDLVNRGLRNRLVLEILIHSETAVRHMNEIRCNLLMHNIRLFILLC
jgi:hypothetical protein